MVKLRWRPSCGRCLAKPAKWILGGEMLCTEHKDETIGWLDAAAIDYWLFEIDEYPDGARYR